MWWAPSGHLPSAEHSSVLGAGSGQNKPSKAGDPGQGHPCLNISLLGTQNLPLNSTGVLSKKRVVKYFEESSNGRTWI